jgi:hypothetical protein
MERSSNPLLDLPNEILAKISENLSTKDYKNFRNITSETRSRLLYDRENMGYLSHPNEILNQILDYLPTQDLKNLERTSTEFELLAKKKRGKKVISDIRKIFDEQYKKLDKLQQFPSDNFEPMYHLLILIKNNYYMFSNPFINSLCRFELEKLYSFVKDFNLKDKKDVYWTIKGALVVIRGLEKIVANILPIERQTNKEKFISNLEKLMNRFNKVVEYFREDYNGYRSKLDELFIAIVDLCVLNLNHIQNKFVKESLDTLEYTWIEDLDGGGNGIQGTPWYNGAIEKLYMLTMLQSRRNYYSFLEFMNLY